MLNKYLLKRGSSEDIGLTAEETVIQAWCCSAAQLCPTLGDPTDRSTPGLPVHRQLQSLPNLMSIESVIPSNHLVLCRLLLFMPSICPSIRVFSNESALHHQVAKYWSFCFSITPSNKYSGLISFQINWFDLLPVQETLKSSPVPQFESPGMSVAQV